MVEKIFFQSSLPRAGSTLFQNLMGQNPDFYVTPTSGVLELVFAARGNYTNSLEFKAQDAELMRKGFMGFCKGGVEGFFNSVTDKKYVLDKSRGWGAYRPFLDAFYPDPKIICLIRDLRDIVCSYEKIYRKNQADKHDSVRDDITGMGTLVHSRVDVWMNPKETIGRAVTRLKDIILQGYDSKMLFVKFEDLCLYPKSQMIRIYDYLGIDYFEHDFDNIPQITKEDDEVYGLGSGLHTINNKLKPQYSNAKSVLGADVCEWIFNNYKWFFDKFQYKK